mgnify:CR=1 FL=1
MGQVPPWSELPRSLGSGVRWHWSHFLGMLRRSVRHCWNASAFVADLLGCFGIRCSACLWYCRAGVGGCRSSGAALWRRPPRSAESRYAPRRCTARPRPTAHVTPRTPARRRGSPRRRSGNGSARVSIGAYFYDVWNSDGGRVPRLRCRDPPVCFFRHGTTREARFHRPFASQNATGPSTMPHS